MTEPAPMNAVELQAFLWGLGSSIATHHGAAGIPTLVLPPRGPSPAAHRAAVDAAVADLAAECDQMLSRKRIPPTGTPAATLGRRLVSDREVLDIANNTYAPGPGLAAMIAVVRAVAANDKEQPR